MAGFVFFQGWNDMVDGAQREEKYVNYTKRLAMMIDDLRKELGSPELPVVIGELGAKARGDFQAAQKAVHLRRERRRSIYTRNITVTRTSLTRTPQIPEKSEPLWNSTTIRK